MGVILNIHELNKLSILKKAGRKLVLVGGVFDILHAGHLEFLKKAKAAGDILVVILESDERTQRLKGEGRPINNQIVRAQALSNLPVVDSVILLPDFKNDLNYQELVKKIEPDIIAVTKGDPIFDLKKRYAAEAGGEIVKVIERMGEFSTTKLVKNRE